LDSSFSTGTACSNTIIRRSLPLIETFAQLHKSTVLSQHSLSSKLRLSTSPKLPRPPTSQIKGQSTYTYYQVDGIFIVQSRCCLPYTPTQSCLLSYGGMHRFCHQILKSVMTHQQVAALNRPSVSRSQRGGLSYTSLNARYSPTIKPVNEYEDDENDRDVFTTEETNSKLITKYVEVIAGATFSVTFDIKPGLCITGDYHLPLNIQFDGKR
jgi:hypothetical protein